MRDGVAAFCRLHTLGDGSMIYRFKLTIDVDTPQGIRSCIFRCGEITVPSGAKESLAEAGRRAWSN